MIHCCCRRLMKTFTMMAMAIIRLDSVTRVSASTAQGTSPIVPTATTTSRKAKKQTLQQRATPTTATITDSYNSDAFGLLAQALHPIMLEQNQHKQDAYETKQVVDAFNSISRAQQTLKTLDGISHEAYQRTHSAYQVDETVRGRARRSAARASAAADALFACELCAFIEATGSHEMIPPTTDAIASMEAWTEAIMEGRRLLYNDTLTIDDDDNNQSLTLKIHVLYEPNYRGGAGGIQEAAPQHVVHGGRVLVILSDSAADNLQQTLQYLHNEPIGVPISKPAARVIGKNKEEQVAFLHPLVYRAAGQVAECLGSLLHEVIPDGPSKDTAIHFVGRSLAGGVASIAAIIFDGGLPMPASTVRPKRKRRSKTTELIDTNGDAPLQTLSGIARHKTSAIVLGGPPCVSANVHTECVTSILYGDDIVCRSTKQSLDRLAKRVSATCARSSGGLIGRQLSRMTDTFSIAASSLKKQQNAIKFSSHVLSIPGRAFLVRPRRLENHCSMHEVGPLAKQKREALRAAVLWQLNDVLLSKSLWKHHELESYIHGLDRVQLRGVHNLHDSGGTNEEQVVEVENDAQSIGEQYDDFDDSGDAMGV
ncbi:hypothetical protein MPSEU_000430800 [Mayamaea pseudoterrestris]|nr:hypothetical protein MPSEU_000430800 [Mayamaea pseudoterrestris]